MPPASPLHQPRLALRAHAKLNLALSVGPPVTTGSRKGFHPIASWFVPIDLADALELERLPAVVDSRFVIEWADDAARPTPIDWPIEKDLAVRAHALLSAHVRRPLPVSMLLRKRIPVGGGLGGGSSDAAAMLTALNQLFALDLDSQALRALGAHLGSDVPFFIDGDAAPSRHAPRSAIVTGLGEAVQRQAAPPRTGVLLAIPPFGCPTAAVYQAFDRTPGPGLREAAVRSLAAQAGRSGYIDGAALFNDLAEPACIAEPRMREVLRRVRAAAGDVTPVHVTGSGSAMFMLPAPGSVPELERAIPAACPDISLVRTHTL